MSTIEACTDIHLDLGGRRTGKVRVSYDLDSHRRLFVTTDRLSAFDNIVAAVPFKGQVLNELAAWWFRSTSDIVDNHVLDVPDPNVLIAHAASPLPVEVVVRGVMTGSTSTSLWHQYSQGARSMYGYSFDDGITKNSPLPQAIITPTTKGDAGAHDEPLSCAEVVERGLVEASLWSQIQEVALALFAHGQFTAKAAGLLLADTKYEFGLHQDGHLMIIDEMHTPDSSRFWELDTYRERISQNLEPESLDKEPIRLALAALGYRGDGKPPRLDNQVIAETSTRYITAYERLTGDSFRRGTYPVQDRIENALQKRAIL
ncbi:MAG: phosphoribosylaminoimidazolesuccinocarboxamide synthase [Ilumatobacteraceae bacterium]